VASRTAADALRPSVPKHVVRPELDEEGVDGRFVPPAAVTRGAGLRDPRPVGLHIRERALPGKGASWCTAVSHCVNQNTWRTLRVKRRTAWASIELLKTA